MDGSSRECVPKLGRGGGRSPPVGVGVVLSHVGHVSARPRVSPSPLCWARFPPRPPRFTRGHCPGGAGKCRSQISQRSRSGAGPCCLRRGNKFAIGWWVRRWEQGHGAPSWCETKTQRLGKRAGTTCKVPIWWPWPGGGGTRMEPPGPPGPFSSQQPRGGTTAANGAEVMAKARLGGRGRGDGKLSKSDMMAGGDGQRGEEGAAPGTGGAAWVLGSITTGPGSPGAACGSLLASASRARGVQLGSPPWHLSSFGFCLGCTLTAQPFALIFG